MKKLLLTIFLISSLIVVYGQEVLEKPQQEDLQFFVDLQPTGQTKFEEHNKLEVVGELNELLDIKEQRQSTVSSQERKKVGVVLSGGGAKGFSHIGVLKVLEEVGIPIDYIAGTSMGAVVGGLYAVGYTTDIIDSLIQIQDWNYLMTDAVYREHVPASQRNNENRYVVSLPYDLPFGDGSGGVTIPTGVYTGQNIYNLFLNHTIGYHNDVNFDDLPIPFGCISADIRTGDEIVMREGNLAEAIRASMAIPGLFTPVEKDSMLLIDGGVINNYPVDLVRDMGADIVIGVVFSPDEKELEESKGSIFEITEHIWNFIGQHKRNSNILDTDILITPDIYPFGMLDFQQPDIDTIITRGVTAALEMRDELVSLKKSLGIDEESVVSAADVNPYIHLDTLTINNIFVEGITERERSYLDRWIDIEDGIITIAELNDIIAKTYGSGMFNSVYYRLEGEDPFDLIFEVDVKKSTRLNLGLHFDSNDMAAILANTTLPFGRSLNSLFEITTRLSRDPYLMIDYSINRGIFYKGGINYKLSRNDLKFYEKGNLAYNLGLTKNSLNVVFSEFYFRNTMLRLGANMEHFHFFRVFGSVFDEPMSELNDQLYFNYSFSGVYDNLNSVYFPTSGMYFAFQYSLHTDNFIRLNGKAPLSVAKMNLHKPFGVSENIYITPKLAARYVMNDSVPLMYRNMVGGRIDGHYMPQQISVQGSTGMEFLENMVISADVTLHYNFTSNNYIYTNLNFTVHNDHLHTLFEGESFFGVNLGYSYMTVAGPIRVELGYSGISRGFYPYFSFGYYF